MKPACTLAAVALQPRGVRAERCGVISRGVFANRVRADKGVTLGVDSLGVERSRGGVPRSLGVVDRQTSTRSRPTLMITKNAYGRYGSVRSLRTEFKNPEEPPKEMEISQRDYGAELSTQIQQASSNAHGPFLHL